MTVQRRRGLEAKVFPRVHTTDDLGNELMTPDMSADWTIRVWWMPLRSSVAEVAGQQEVEENQIGTDADLTGLEAWSRVFILGEYWDVVTPPRYHHGTRHTRHWQIDIRRRPDPHG